MDIPWTDLFLRILIIYGTFIMHEKAIISHPTALLIIALIYWLSANSLVLFTVYYTIYDFYTESSEFLRFMSLFKISIFLEALLSEVVKFD